MLNLLWDLDGTVVDSMPVIAKSLNETCLSYGKPEMLFEDVRPFIGPELSESLAFLLELDEQEAIQEAVQVYRSVYVQEMHKSPLFGGLQDVLDHFHQNGIKQYIATSKYQVYAQQIIASLGLTDRFIVVYGSQSDGQLGDKKDLLAHILEVEALKPAQTVMIGDTRFDIEAGRHHNFSTVGVLWGYGGKEALEQAGAHYLAKQPQDMPSIIRQAVECGC